MINIEFLNVDQGDTIIFEWEYNLQKLIGIIDASIDKSNNNPLLNFLQRSNYTEIEFIILTHLHYVHFSGMADILEYCLQKNIRVKSFCHTLSSHLSHYFERIFTSQKLQQSIKKFIEAYNKFSKNIDNVVQVSDNVKDLYLTDKISLCFLSPSGSLYDVMAIQLARKINTYPVSYRDLNKLAPLILLKNDSYCALLTSDSIKKNFKKLKKKINQPLILIQVPHHGSWGNVYEDFWSLDKIENCPAIFSVGDEPKDKLPNIETVEFFHKKNFAIYSTNYVYEIRDYFNETSKDNKSIIQKSVWDNFSRKLKSTNQSLVPSNFQGNQRFKLFE